jgi:hypothetical protein
LLHGGPSGKVLLQTFRKGVTDMVIKEEKQSLEKRSDLLIWVAACVLMVWIIFLGLITQAR